jgi:hypothetical protein
LAAVLTKQVLADIDHHQIQIFEPPRYELDDDETISENREIMSKIPFAIVGSNTAVKTRDGRIVRAREYPWGVIEVDNEEHCDFVKLRQMLIRYWFFVPLFWKIWWGWGVGVLRRVLGFVVGVLLVRGSLPPFLLVFTAFVVSMSLLGFCVVC